MATITIERPNKNLIILRAFLRGKEVGDARFETLKSKGEYYVRGIFVNDYYQRRGIGTLLMTTGMKQEQVRTVLVSTHKSVLPFYLKLGFKIVKEKILRGYDLLWDKAYI